jgi:hypothetical protein
MKNSWFNGIVAVCFLVLSYLFTTSHAHISGFMFLVLAVVFAIRAFVGEKA